MKFMQLSNDLCQQEVLMDRSVASDCVTSFEIWTEKATRDAASKLASTFVARLGYELHTFHACPLEAVANARPKSFALVFPNFHE